MRPRNLICALALLPLAFAAAHAAPAAPDLDALVTYETRQLTASGVTRTETWRERIVRRGDVVWSERVLPAAAVGHVHGSAAAPTAHKHFDFERAARWVQRDANGQLQLRFVDRAHRTVVSVPKAEYAAVGFDGRWDAAAHLVPPSVVERMTVAPAGRGTAQWRTESANGWRHRVLWSPARQTALRIESTRDDGSARRVVSVEPSNAAPRALPWSGVEGYTQREYDDFMD